MAVRTNGMVFWNVKRRGIGHYVGSHAIDQNTENLY